MNTFVFLQVGNDPRVEMMVNSINLTNPNARIIQCSDPNTKKIGGVTDIFRLGSDSTNLMTFRLEAFTYLKLTEPAIYLDTDMLILTEIFINQFLQDTEVALCQRSFGRDTLLNTRFRNMDLSEYANKTLGQVYPILACFTATKSHEFWKACLLNLWKLDKKFHWWYGDQEAMRNIASNGDFNIRYLAESDVACLPEYANDHPNATGIHFKGASRKSQMENFYQLHFQ